MTNFGDVIISAISGDPIYQSSIVVASSPSGPNPVQYNREDAETLTDAQASGIAQDLAGEGIDHGYYNQYDDPPWYFEYRSQNVAGVNNNLVAGWTDTGTASAHFGFNNTGVYVRDTGLDTTGSKYRAADVKYLHPINEDSLDFYGLNISDQDTISELGSHSVGAVFAKLRMTIADDVGIFWRFESQSTPASGNQRIDFRLTSLGSVESHITTTLFGVTPQNVQFKSTTGLISLNQWYRVGYKQEGSEIRLWLDGSELSVTQTGTAASAGFWLKNLEARSGGSGIMDRLVMMGETGGNDGFVGDIAHISYTPTTPSDSMMKILTNPNTSNF